MLEGHVIAHWKFYDVIASGKRCGHLLLLMRNATEYQIYQQVIQVMSNNYYYPRITS